MWLLLFMITGWCVLAYIMGRPKQSLFIVTILATGFFQLLPIGWFWSPFLLVKPYDYAYVAMGLILIFNLGRLGQIVARERVAKFAVFYLVFLVLVLLVSVFIFSYPKGKTIQSARVFFWPVFLLFFMLIDRAVLERFIKALYPIVTVLALVYLSQPFHGKAIINPSSEYFNPYLGSTDVKRYLSTPDFLIFFLLLTYVRFFSCKELSVGARFKQIIVFFLLVSVQVVSFTRSAIMGTGIAILYVSKRVVNSLFLTLFLACMAGGLAIAYTTSSLVEERVNESLKDISATLNGSYESLRAQKDGNLSFRMAHLHERLTYIANDIRRWPVGIGFVHEDSAVAQNLGFRIGLKNFFTGRAIQVDTGDIAWSVVVIKTGLLGLALLIVFLLMTFFSVGAKADPYAVVYRGGLAYFVVTSFFSNSLVSPNQMLPLMLFLAIALANKLPASVESPRRVGSGAQARKLAVT